MIYIFLLLRLTTSHFLLVCCCQLLLPPASQNSPGSPAQWAKCHSMAGFSIHFIATWLLQLTVVSSARINYSASAACDECSDSSCHEVVIVQACETSIELPVEQRITYKLCLFMHHIHIRQAPQYLSDCVSTVSAAVGRYRLRSTGSAVFSTPVQLPWTLFPSDLRDITDTSRFRKQLKSILFDCAYHWLLLALL